MEKTPLAIARVRTFGSEHLLTPVSICSDVQGNVYVGDEGRLGVHKFKPDLTYDMAFGDFGQDESKLLTPVDLFCEGLHIYVVDGRNERIAKYDWYGGFLDLFSPVGTDTLGSGPPVAIAVSHTGQIYVLETRPGQVLALDEFGRIRSAFGRFGGESGLSRPTSIALGPRSEVYVCDAGRGRVAVYDVFGGYLRGIEGLENPSDIAVDEAGNIYACDPDQGTVTCYDREGNGIAAVDGFASPQALAVVDENTLLVVDTENGTVVVCEIRYQ